MERTFRLDKKIAIRMIIPGKYANKQGVVICVFSLRRHVCDVLL